MKKELIYGMHACKTAYLNLARKNMTLYGTAKSLELFKETLNEAKNRGIKREQPLIREAQFFSKKCGDQNVHQHICLDSEILHQPSLKDLISSQTEKHFIVILDQVTDPQNIGAIMRSACAFGAKAVIVQDKNAPDLTPIIYKNACGAVEHLPYLRETNLSKTIELMKKEGYWIYGLSEHGKASFSQINFPEKTVIILGAEGSGMRRLIMENCDELCHLPTQEPLPTLNVSNAAACAFYSWKTDKI